MEVLWNYVKLRASLTDLTNALWVDTAGKGMEPDWLRLMLRRLGKAAGVPNLHPHRFRHTYAVTALRSGMAERVPMLNGG